MLPKNSDDWRNLWASLLQGVGTGLLEYDGSRAAQAALAGLDAFNGAQERLRRYQREQDNVDYPQQASVLPDWSEAERAAFLRMGSEEQAAFVHELMAGVASEQSSADASRSGESDGMPAWGFRPALSLDRDAATRRRPFSANPFDAWGVGLALPFGPGGRLNAPRYRR